MAHAAGCDLAHAIGAQEEAGKLVAPRFRHLAQTLSARFAHREKRDLERLQSVLDFTAHTGCRTRYLLHYFGEPLDHDCGHCDACLNESAPPLTPSSPHPLISNATLQTIRDLKSRPHPALSTPRQLARFLCGINSPAATRAKLRAHAAFGLLSDVPFATVLETVKG